MAFDYEAAFTRIINKARIIQQRYLKMLDERKNALEAMQDLRAQLAEKDRIIEQLQIRLEYMQVASTIAPTREQLDKSKTVISDLVREIDRCISELSD